MARARNIKPGFFKNEDLGTADPFVSLLFAGLWTLADKAGILEDRPLRIKAELFPYREGFDINGYLTVLVRFKLIHRYEVDGVGYIQIVNFLKHQNPHHTEKASEYPAYSDSCSITVNTPLNTGSTPADSLIPDSLNTDSLIPDSVKSSGEESPDQSEKNPAKEILEYLNAKSGRAFKPVEANLKFINARLRDYTVDELKSVIDKKCDEWLDDPVMSAYIRPETLFNATKCAGYVVTPPMGKRQSQGGFKTKQQIIRENNDKAWEEFLNDDSSYGDEKIIEGEVIRD